VSRRAETTTGGRDATTRHIFGQFALSVGMPDVVAPPGWRWLPLTDVARMESGHTPSRNHLEYWGGDVPWIGIRDAKAHHGQTIHETIQNTNELGIQNSSARILPEGTVCLSRTASVGYVVTMGRPMATSQDFANWICSEQIDRRFLVYLLLAEQDSLLRFASGAIHQTIYYPELKALHVCLPPLPEQQRIVAIIDEASAGLATATANAEKNLENARELFESYLGSVFARRGAAWVDKSINEVADHCLGKMLDRNKNRGDPKPYLRNLNVRWFEFDLTDVLEMRFEKNEIDRYSAIKGDLLICEGGYPGRAAIWQRDEPIFFQKAIHRVRFHAPHLNKWFLYFLYLMDSTGELHSHFTGAGIQHFTGQALAKFKLPIPPASEVVELVGKFDQLAAQSRLLENSYRKKLDQIAALKQCILQKAFSGELTSPPSQAIREAAE
jgi:type I restriction enzyme, S subunit